MKMHAWIAAAALLAAPMPAAAQQADVDSAPPPPPPPPAAHHPMDGPMPPAAPRDGGPIQMLIEHRDTLGLTDDQVERLEAIRDSVRAVDEPLLEELIEIRREVREKLPEDVRERRHRRSHPRLDADLRAELRPQLRRTRELMVQLRRNAQGARDAVREVLTAEQRERVRAWIDARRGRHDRMRRGPRPGDGPPRFGGPRLHGLSRGHGGR